MLAKAFVMLITLFRRLIKVNILSWEKLKSNAAFQCVVFE